MVALNTRLLQLWKIVSIEALLESTVTLDFFPFLLFEFVCIGTLFGVGVYFSSDAVYSHGYAKPNANGDRNMFLARVLVGNTTKGNSSMKVRPVGFDSTTNGNHIFVTYHDAQAYAEYLITYK